jgi:uncharacterized protein DUF4157
MNMRLQTQVKAAAIPAQSFTPVPTGLLQRKCACGGSPGLIGECVACMGKRLQHASFVPEGRRTEGEGSVRSVVHDVLRSPGQPLDAATRAFMEARFGHDFGRVRVHTDAQAAESAQAVNALAYTAGRDIVFGAGQYTPHTSRGRHLLAHELAHTVQQGAATPALGHLQVTAPTDATEQEADALAQTALQGNVKATTQRAPLAIARQAPTQTQPQAAPTAPTPAPTAFAGEDPTLRARRLAVIAAAGNAIQRLRGALAGGFIWPFVETVTPNGVDHAPFYGQPTPETAASREARLRELIADLIRLSIELESAPIPAAWLAPNAQFSGGSIGIHAATQTEQDTLMFYTHRSAALGRDMNRTFLSGYYINAAPLPNRQMAPVPIRSGVGLGIYIVVEDPDNAPLVYRRLTSREGWNTRGVIMEVWSDDSGYYYPYQGRKVYLPGRP